MDIPGVPDGVTWKQLGDALRTLGLDPTDVAEAEFRKEAIYVTVYARKDGSRYFDGDRWRGTDGDVAKHRVAIPIVGRVSEPALKFGVTVDPKANPADVGRKMVDAIRGFEGRGDGPEPQPA